MKEETVKTDVLVIGGGGAGLLAALEARKAKVEVLLVSKTVLGGGSCTTLSFGALRVSDTTEAKEEHYAQSLAAGKNINDLKLLRTLVQNAYDGVRRLEEFDIPVLHEPPYFYIVGEPPFYGKVMTAKLQKAAGDMGVVSLGQTVAIDLLKEDGRVCGALVYAPSGDKLIKVLAQSVVLATGGAGALYPIHDNSPRTTGDGFAIASRAGAKLRDMEFVQFYPLGLMEGGSFRCIVPASLADCGRIRNALGEDILSKWRIQERPAAVKARDALSQAMFREIMNGRGAGAALEIDLRHVREKDWNENRQVRQFKKILQEKYPGLERPLKIAPVCHHFMGGVAVDERCRTNLPGLFAAGETTGGLHGANRMGGNALSECVVFGRLAGREASAFARAWKGSLNPSSLPVEKAKRRMARWREGPFEDRSTPKELKESLGRVMFEMAGIVRDQKKLERARSDIERLERKALSRLHCGHARNMLRAFELLNLIATAKLVVRGALMRKESRGSHCREDFPHSD